MLPSPFHRWESRGSESPGLPLWLQQVVCTQPRSHIHNVPIRTCSSPGSHRAFLGLPHSEPGSSSQTPPVLTTQPTRTPPFTTCWMSSSFEQFLSRIQEGTCPTAQAAESRGHIAPGQCPGPTLLHHSPPGRRARAPVQSCTAGGQERWQPGRIQPKELFRLMRRGDPSPTPCPRQNAVVGWV